MIVDTISSLKDSINGLLVDKGQIYIPDPERRMIYIGNMTEEQKKEEEDFRINRAPKLLEKYEEKLKEYIVDDPNL